jgi:cytochrome b
MKKPVIIRLIGWGGTALVVVSFVMSVNATQTGHEYPLSFLGGFLALVGFLCWGVWALASAVLWVMRKQAATTAAILRDVHHVDVPQATRVGARPLDRLYCIAHKTWVPFGGLAQHDSQQCLYVPDLPGRFTKAPAPAHPAPPATSPLGLNQNR